MELLLQGLGKVFEDPEVLNITIFTLRVSATATLLSVLIGIPIGFFLATRTFSGRNLVISIVNLGMGLPPVVVGLWVSLLLWRSGPLGAMGLQYTPTAILIAQGIIASPIVTGFSTAAFGQTNPKLQMQIKALGASRWQLIWLMICEARLGLLAAVIAGFGAAISEVGAAMMVGGNIFGYTRTLTTATVLEVNKGHYDIAIALGTVLLVLAFIVTVLLTLSQQKGRYI
ncbi:MAG TPA: ABC transporter permease [Clostridia bacterium]|nr:ABC transporter permease [Clostridia bacterium]